jgi:sulfocyanin
MGIRSSRHLAGALALGLSLLVLSLLVGANAVSARQASAPTWVITKGKTVTLTLIAAYNNTQGGFNFNGGANGKLTITVPQGDTVNVNFTNKASLPHSAVIVASAQTPASLTSYSPAFQGASSPNPTAGSPSGKIFKFSFTATKAGNYLLVCAVPGHVAAGMWDTFVVSKTAKVGRIVMKS